MGQQVKSLAFRFSLSSVSKPNIVDRERERDQASKIFPLISAYVPLYSFTYSDKYFQPVTKSISNLSKTFLSIKNRFNVKETWKIVIITEASTLLGTHPKNKHKQGYEGPQ